VNYSASTNGKIKNFIKLGLKGILSTSRHPRVKPSNLLVDPNLQKILENQDLLVITGGDVYSSEYGWSSLRYYLSLIHTAHSLSIPVALLGHTVGRFTSKEDLDAWLDAAGKIELLTARDSETYDYLAEVGGLPKNSFITSDVAFCLQKAHTAPELREDTRRPTVSLSISAGIVKWSNISLAQHYSAWKQIIYWLLNDLNVNIIMIPHVHEVYGDDRCIQSSLHRDFSFDSRISVASEDLTAAEYKKIISDTDLMIAERMHAAIASISTNVPTVLSAYSLKAYGLAKDAYGQSTINRIPPVFDVNEYANCSNVISTLSLAWRAREELRNVLIKSVPMLKSQATSNFSHLNELITQLQ
jgi:colanic acid/amylovoran biosynthesis protein